MKGQFIYKIVNTTNGKFYVGSTVNTRERFRNHRSQLRRGVHHTKHLQASWNKYGEQAFVFHIIETIPDGQSLQDAEDVWLIAHVGKPYCYNVGLRSGAPWRGVIGDKNPMYGVKMSEEAKEAIRQHTYQQWQQSDPRTGAVHSDETKALISSKVQAALLEGRGGKFIPSAETRQKMSVALMGNQCAKGYKRTDAEREAIRQRTLGNQHWVGKTHTDASKAKMSKTVFVMPVGVLFPSLTSVLSYYALKMPTLTRALKSGKPLSKGRMMGYSFSYGGVGAVQTQTDKDLIANKLLAQHI